MTVQQQNAENIRGLMILITVVCICGVTSALIRVAITLNRRTKTQHLGDGYYYQHPKVEINQPRPPYKLDEKGHYRTSTPATPTRKGRHHVPSRRTVRSR